MRNSSNPQMKNERWFLVVAIALLVACTIATWGAEQKAAALDEPAPLPLADYSSQTNVGSVVVQASSTPEPTEHGGPTSTPQPGSGWHGESRSWTRAQPSWPRDSWCWQQPVPPRRVEL